MSSARCHTPHVPTPLLAARESPFVTYTPLLPSPLKFILSRFYHFPHERHKICLVAHRDGILRLWHQDLLAGRLRARGLWPACHQCVVARWEHARCKLLFSLRCNTGRWEEEGGGGKKKEVACSIPVSIPATPPRRPRAQTHHQHTS